MRLLFTLCFSLFMSVFTLQAQLNADPVVMTVNGVPVTRSEFLYSYNKNNGIGQSDRKSVEDYAELYAIYKLKVAAALEAQLDTSAAFRQELAMYSDRQSGGAVILDTDLQTEARRLYDRTKKAIGTQGLIDLRRFSSDCQPAHQARNRIVSPSGQILSGVLYRLVLISLH